MRTAVQRRIACVLGWIAIAGAGARGQEPGPESALEAVPDVTGVPEPESTGLLAHRLARKRLLAREEPGRSEVLAIDRALQWLALHQSGDGRWDADGFPSNDPEGAKTDGAGGPEFDVGITSLALLALLGDGNTTERGPYRTNVRRGVRWLCRQQGPETGGIGPIGLDAYIYCHALATQALVEAAGLSGDHAIRLHAERALSGLHRLRHEFNSWPYALQGGPCDISVLVWCAQACHAGDRFGFDPGQVARERRLKWDELSRIFVLAMKDPVSGRVGYRERGGRSSRRDDRHAEVFPVDANETLTAGGLFAEYLAGAIPGDIHNAMPESAELIAGCPPDWDPESGKIDFLAWFLASHALFQHGGRHWRDWHAAQGRVLAEHQRSDATFEGSWDPCGVWGDDLGRIGTTALAALTLQAPYRLPRVRRE